MKAVNTVKAVAATIAATIAVTAAPSYAAVAYSQINNAKLIDHFEEYGVSLPNALQAPKYVSATAEAHEGHGMVGTTVSATGSFAFVLENDFNYMSSYIVEVYMCIQNKDCYHTRDTFAVEPFKKAGINGTAYTYSYITKAGVYEDECTVAISGSGTKTVKGVNKVTVA